VGLEFLTQDFTLAKQVLHHQSYISRSFCSGYFGDGVSETICLELALISAFQVARFTGVSHQHSAHRQVLILAVWAVSSAHI
jgi:hypothetical protein